MAATANPEKREAIKNGYEVEYSRFFSYPKTKLRRGGGTWLSSSSSASLRLLTHFNSHSLPQVLLLISLRGKTHEEHFISKLQFSWPQMSCVSQCPVRGSRVVFACYKDCIGQTQKFAMRFSNSYESQTFINYVKECFKDARNIELPCCNLRSEVPSQTENSNDVQDRANQELDFVNLIDNYSPLMQSPLNYQSEQYARKQHFPMTWVTHVKHCLQASQTSFLTVAPRLSKNLQRKQHFPMTWVTCEALPPSFTDLLADCCTEVEQEPPTELEEVDLKSQIARYMTTTSFHDMLSKVEKVITDTGGDLAL